MNATSKTILIAEDSPVQAELLRRGLESAGYQVMEARDGQHALELARAAPPAALVSDIRMPRMDGYQLCRAIRSDEALDSMPVILLTELSDPLDVIRGLDAGADAYVTKPHDFPTLVQRIESLTAFPVPRPPSAERRRAKVRVSGETHEVAAHGPRMLNLLISTYENAVLQNRQLAAAQNALEYLNADLEQRVMVKTEGIRRLNRVHALLSGINSVMLRIRDRKELFEQACQVAVDAGSFVMAWVCSVDIERDAQLPVACAGEQALSYHDALALTVTTVLTRFGKSVDSMKDGEPAVINDISSHPDAVLRRECAKRGINSLVALPLLQGGQVVALMKLYAAETGFFDEEELVLLRNLASDVSFSLDYISKSEQVNYLAYYDVLTGLPNRELLLDRVGQHLAHAGAQQQGAALLMLDVQRFRNVNDTLGRSAGDEILKTIAERLTAGIGPEVTAARIGADLFALLAKDVSHERDAMKAAREALQACFEEPFLVGGSELRLAGRIGIALFPNDANDADGLYRNAETVLARARKTGEDCLFYSPDMSARIAQKLSMESRLRRAIDDRQFVLHYQPKFSSRTGGLTSVEALIRWNDPENGLVPPMQFIPLLEETGLIIPVGEWALREAVRQHGAWLSQGLMAPRIAVNVSAIQLHGREFIPMLRDVVADAPGGNHGIDLELTETLVMTNVEENIPKLAAARQMGMQVFVDDFGTGYSSLRYIAKLPLDALKVDRSFIISMANSPEDMTIVSSVISLARDLNLKVVAEGVDSEEQAKLLRLLKCDEMQGFLFAKPMPADQLAALLENPREMQVA